MKFYNRCCHFCCLLNTNHTSVKRGCGSGGWAHLQQQRILEDSLNWLDEVGVDGKGVAHRPLTHLGNVMWPQCNYHVILYCSWVWYSSVIFTALGECAFIPKSSVCILLKRHLFQMVTLLTMCKQGTPTHVTAYFLQLMTSKNSLSSSSSLRAFSKYWFPLP